MRRIFAVTTLVLLSWPRPSSAVTMANCFGVPLSGMFERISWNELQYGFFGLRVALLEPTRDRPNTGYLVFQETYCTPRPPIFVATRLFSPDDASPTLISFEVPRTDGAMHRFSGRISFDDLELTDEATGEYFLLPRR